MSAHLDEHHQPLRRYPAHYAAAAIALAGAVAVQLGWPEIVGRPQFDSWWPLDVVLVLVTTGYLLALAESQLRAATWRPNKLVPRLWHMGQALGANLIIAAAMVFILWDTPRSSVMRAGLWMLPAALLAAVVASGLTIIFALLDGWQRFSTDIPPASAPSGKPRSELVLGILAVGLVLAIYIFEQVEPPNALPAASGKVNRTAE
jgi:hypothetical protein